MMERDQFWLSDRQFARIAPHLPTDTRGKPRVDDRRVISGIVHVLKSGCRWVDAPAVYGPRKTLYNRFVRWAAKGVWMNIFHALAAAGGPPADVLIDSSAVKAHRCAAGGQGGRISASFSATVSLARSISGVTPTLNRVARDRLNQLRGQANGKAPNWRRLPR
jgi:transposase